MSSLTLFLLLQAFFGSALSLPSNQRSTSPTVSEPIKVNTTSGIFASYFSQLHPDIASFPNIPYAQNPTGILRFAPPVPATPPTDSRVTYASNLPAGCFQYVPSYYAGTEGFAGNRSSIFQRGDYTNTTEDCLRLSIFAPTSAVERAALRGQHHQASSIACHNKDPYGKEELLPVIVWIHGGGFELGGTNVPYQLAPNWVQRSQRHIVVQVQYRLNLLGFPNAAGLAADGKNINVGLLDQRLAVEWVRNNIAGLGGDPSRITLWGQSAGACSADAYLFAWAADPIVAGVIADSGNALVLEAGSTSTANYSQFSHVASQLGCAGLNPNAELACMRAVPTSTLQAFIQNPVGEGVGDSLSFPLVVDNITVTSNYEGRIVADRGPVRVPMLIGTNTDEGNAIVPYNFNGSAAATLLPTNIAPIAEGFKLSYQCTTLRETRIRAAAGAHSWQYQYAGNFSDLSPRPWLGAYHTAGLPLIFGTFGMDGPATELEKGVSQNMQDLYLAFAADPSEGLTKAGWPLVTGAQGSPVMKWAADGKIGQLVDIKDMRDECIKNGYEV